MLESTLSEQAITHLVGFIMLETDMNAAHTHTTQHVVLTSVNPKSEVPIRMPVTQI